jgi:hypothetical protein
MPGTQVLMRPHGRLAVQALNLPGKNTTARAAVRLQAEFRPETPMLSTRNHARPSPKGQSLRNIPGFARALGLSRWEAAPANIAHRLPQTLAPSAQRPAGCGKPDPVASGDGGAEPDPGDGPMVRGPKPTGVVPRCPGRRVASPAETVFSWRVSERA